MYAPCFLPSFLNPQHLKREDKQELRKLYKSYPRLLRVYDDYIDTDIPCQGTEMIEYNLMLDKYRDTNFFETFPQYRKYYASSS